MKRLRCCALVLLLVDSAGADPVNPCGAPASAVKAPYIDLSTAGALYGCAPKPLGTGTLPTIRSNPAGTVAWWYCPTPDGKWRLNWAAATAARMSVDTLFAEAYEVVTAKDPIAAFNSVTAKNVSIPMSDPTLAAVWCPFVREMQLGTPAVVVAPSLSGLPYTPRALAAFLPGAAATSYSALR